MSDNDEFKTIAVSPETWGALKDLQKITGKMDEAVKKALCSSDDPDIKKALEENNISCESYKP